MRLLRNSLLVALVVALLAPASALAGPIEDCADDGQLSKQYSQGELDDAKKNLPSDLSDYSDCGEVLNGAKAKGPDQGSSSGGGGASAPETGGGAGAAAAEEIKAVAKPTAADLARERRERAAIDNLVNGGGKPNLSLDGKTISPGDAGLYDLASATHEVPLPVKLALYAVALLALAGLLVAGRRRFPALGFGRQAFLSRVSRLRR